MNNLNERQCDCHIGIDRMVNEGFILYDADPNKTSSRVEENKRKEE